MPKKVYIPNLDDCAVIRRHNNLQFWRRAADYRIIELLQRRNLLSNTITKLTNANINNHIFMAIVDAAKDVQAKIDPTNPSAMKNAVIAELQKEHDDIEYLLTYGSNSSSSSSSKSSSSFSSSSSSSSA